MLMGEPSMSTCATMMIEYGRLMVQVAGVVAILGFILMAWGRWWS